MVIFLSVPRMNHGFDEAALVRRALLPVILPENAIVLYQNGIFVSRSSETRNLSAKAKISQSPPLTSFERGWFAMTRVDLSYLTARFFKPAMNYLMQTSF
ncbi:MAG: hypothetical protein ACP5M0_07400 [Desulfomonilaceae bacterium]